jgi:hypothetical protein
MPCARLAALFLLAATLPLTGQAQSSLGLNFGQAGFSLGHSGAGMRPMGQISGDYRITDAHGVQLGLVAADRPGGWIGQFDGHLYLQPAPDRKYGVFATLADINDRSAGIGTAGIEMMWEVAPGTVIEGRAGAGLATGGIDFIAVSGSLSHALGHTTEGFIRGGLAEFDEAALSAVGYTVGTGIRHHLGGTGLELSVAISANGLAGRDSAKAITQVDLGLTWRFGADRGARRPVASRSFETIQPFDPLIVRGLF